MNEPTADEIKKYYDDLGRRVTFKVFQTRDRHERDKAYEAFMKEKNMELVPWLTIGPVGSEDIVSGVLSQAMELPLGEARKFDEPPQYYLVLIAGEEDVVIEPLEALRPEIEKRVLMAKERRLFEDWLKAERKKASIRILEKFN